MKCQSLVALLVGVSTSVIAAPTQTRSKGSDCNTTSPGYCDGTSYNATLKDVYICGDSRLGPVQLPTKLPLDPVLDIYNRFGGLTPGAFLAKWYNQTAGSWIYPGLDGFSLDLAGEPIQGNFTLEAGMLIDRFGSEYGRYASPAGAPYMQRSLPPSSLDTPVQDPSYPYNYHVYRVSNAFAVIAGPIAPWFGQPGQGVQYELLDTIMALVNNGFLEKVDPSVIIA